jgi:hypothetical protein
MSEGLTWRDAAGTALVVFAIAVAASVVYGWHWPLVAEREQASSLSSSSVTRRALSRRLRNGWRPQCGMRRRGVRLCLWRQCLGRWPSCS